MSSKKQPKPPAVRLKKFDSLYAKRPIQCQHCRDFILGTSNPLKVCQECHAVFHPICASYGHITDCFYSMSDQQYQLQKSMLSSTPVNISTWSAEIVREWIAASESHRYFYVFNSKKEFFTGQDLLEPARLISSFRADDLHKQMLCSAIDNAQHLFPLPYDFLEPSTPTKTSSSNSHSHLFSKYECYSTFQCAKCNRSRGVMSYGVKCRKCGMRFHRMCRLLPKLPPCQTKTCPNSEYVFGQDLADGSAMVDRPIPLFLELCTSVIESRLQKTDKSVYVSSAKGVRLQELCTQYGFDKFYEGNGKPINQPTVSLEAIESALKSIKSIDDLAGLLKSYLRELPNPVIPFNVYDDMISLAKQSLPDQRPTDEFVRSVVDKIPYQHRFALSHILVHLEHIHDFFQGAERLGSLFAAFGTILVRPPPHSVRSLANWERGVDYHSIIVKLVYGNPMFKDIARIQNIPRRLSISSTSVPASSGSGISSQSQPAVAQMDSDSTSGSQTTQSSDVYIEFKSWDGQDPSLEPLPSMSDGHRNYERMKARIDICELPFYWKDISKDQEKLLMENESIGNFILRKSSSDPAAFTLVVKSYDFNYMVQIRNYFKPREGWGIAAYAPKFPYIADLIQHYQSHDLSTSPYLHSTSSMNGEDVSRGSVESLNSSQNKHSYIRLRESVNRDLREDPSLTKEKLVNDSMEVDEYERRIVHLKRDLSFIKDNEIPHFAKRKEALGKLSKQLESQLNLLAAGSRNLKAEDKRKLSISEDMLKRRLDVAQNMIEECESKLDILHNKKRSVETDLHKSSTILSAEIRQQTKRRITLELFGIAYEDDILTEKQLFNREKPALWFYEKSVTRDIATKMFELCREHGQMTNGTFLVRKSREGGYAISVWVNGEVMHLKLQYEEKKYGFAYPYINYSSPTDLVVAYTETSLVMHNHNLDTTLTIPIGQIIEDSPIIKAKITELFR